MHTESNSSNVEKITTSSENINLDLVEKNETKISRFNIRNGFFQMLTISLIAFCCPGMFNALTGLGGAGSDDPSVASLTNAVLYLTFTVSGYSGGSFFNMLGPRITIPVGAATYAVYSVFSYLSGNNQDWSKALFILSGGILGFGAGWFWTAQGSIMMAYAPEERKAKYIAIFWVIFNLGGFLGGILTFITNINTTQEASANPISYFVLVGIMGTGVLLSILLILAPEHVLNENGEKVIVPPHKTFMEELRQVAKVITDPIMLCLTPLFFFSNFYYSYIFNSQTEVCNIRTRGLNSAFYWGTQMFGAIGYEFLIKKTSNKGHKRQTFISLIAVMGTQLIAWVCGGILLYVYDGGFAHHAITPLIDVSESRWGYVVMVYVFYGLADSILQTFAYWFMSILGGSDAGLCARYSGFYKGVQSLGAGIAWLLGASFVSAPWVLQYWLCCGLSVSGVFGVLLVVRRMDKLHSGSEKARVGHH